MLNKAKWPVALLLAAMVLVSVLVSGVLLVPASAGTTCYGTLFEYFESASQTVYTGAKVVCPGFPDQLDSGDNGGYSETAWFTTTQVVCPCPGGSGGSGGGVDTDDE